MFADPLQLLRHLQQIAAAWTLSQRGHASEHAVCAGSSRQC